MEFKIYDLLQMFTDTWGTLVIYDTNTCENVFEGNSDDCPFMNNYIQSIDWPSGSKLTINIAIDKD